MYDPRLFCVGADTLASLSTEYVEPKPPTYLEQVAAGMEHSRRVWDGHSADWVEHSFMIRTDEV